jgi:hypothetical protein
MAKFPETFCSSCGGEFGPGDSGYSHCDQHKGIHNRDGGGCDCENCNERAYERQQEALMETGGYPTLRDQQIAAMKFK